MQRETSVEEKARCSCLNVHWNMKVKVLVAQLCLTLYKPTSLQPTSLLCPWDSPGKKVAEKKPILTAYQNCFFDLLFIASVTIIIEKGLPQRILPLCLTVQLKCLYSEPCPPVAGRKEDINTYSCLRPAILGDVCKMNGNFTLLLHPPPISDLLKNLASRPL